MTPYEALGVPPSATKAEIRAAYRALASKYHPDRGGDLEDFQEVQRAYDTIGDDQKRLSYDTLGQASSVPQEDADSVALRELITIFMMIVQNCDPERVDFKREIKKVIHERMNLQKKGISDATYAIAKLNASIKRLYRKKKPTTQLDYFRAALDDTIVKMHQGIARCEELLDLLKRMEEILESDYDFVPEASHNYLEDFGHMERLLRGSTR